MRRADDLEVGKVMAGAPFLEDVPPGPRPAGPRAPVVLRRPAVPRPQGPGGQATPPAGHAEPGRPPERRRGGAGGHARRPREPLRRGPRERHEDPDRVAATRIDRTRRASIRAEKRRGAGENRGSLTLPGD